MSKVCPICKNSLNEVIPEVCEICGWNLSEDITLFPVLNEISKEEIEEYKKKVDTAKEEWKIKTELKKETEEKSSNCPVCRKELGEEIPEVCEICGWNLSEDMTLFPVLNEISKEEIEEYKNSLKSAKDEWDNKKITENTSKALLGNEIGVFVTENHGNWASNKLSDLFSELRIKYGKVSKKEIKLALEEQRKLYFDEKTNREMIEKERLVQQKTEQEQLKKNKTKDSQVTIGSKISGIKNTQTGNTNFGQEEIKEKSIERVSELVGNVLMISIPIISICIPWIIGAVVFNTKTFISFMELPYLFHLSILINVIIYKKFELSKNQIFVLCIPPYFIAGIALLILGYFK